MIKITARDLSHWAEDISSRGEFPVLIRKLIRATVSHDNITRICFPSRTQIDLPGWDGILEVQKGDAFVPTGKSVWEFSVRKDVKNKANEDFLKRDNESYSDLQKSETTYVYCTLRNFPKKDEWIVEKRTNSDWKDVRVISSIELEDWIELAPAVGLDLSKTLNLMPEGAQTLEQFEREWFSLKEKKITHELLLAGRDKVQNQVQQWIQKEKSQITLQADTPNEAIAFLISSVRKLPQDIQEKFFSQSVLVHSEAALREISTIHTCKPLYIIAYNLLSQAVNGALQNGHSVFIASNMTELISKADSINIHQLPRPERCSFEEALRTMGYSDNSIKTMAQETKRSISVLRRLYFQADLTLSEWASPDNAHNMMPFLFCGSWSEQSEGDREVLELLAGQGYEELEKILIQWANIPDTPFVHIGKIWMLQSPLDSWAQLSRFITQNHLDRFKKVFGQVLGEIDPSLSIQSENNKFHYFTNQRQRRFSKQFGKVYLKQLTFLPITLRNGDARRLFPCQTSVIHW